VHTADGRSRGGHVHPLHNAIKMKGNSALQPSHLIAVNEVDEEPDFADGIDGQFARRQVESSIWNSIGGKWDTSATVRAIHAHSCRA
jgi:hypothetical protein